MLVHNKGNFIRHIGDVRLLPGVNELDSEQSKFFEKDMENPLNKALVTKNEIVIIEAESKGKKKKEVSSDFATLGANEAITLVNDTFDLVLLGKWLDEEGADKKRATVIKAIENQIEDIKNPPVDDIVNPED